MENIKNYLKQQLNESQYNSAVGTDTSSLILAGAGSGKTRALTYKIAYLIFAKNIYPSNILAVTFTNKAANEMKDRLVSIAKEVEEESSKSPTTKIEQEDDFDALISETVKENTAQQKMDIGYNSFKWVGTFHSIFLRILKEDIENLDMGYNKYFGVYDEGEALSIIREILKETGLKEQLEPKEVKRFISNIKSQGTTYNQFLHTLENDYQEQIGKVYEKYQKRLQESNALDFDDLLLLPLLLFDNNQEILEKWQKKFKYILVDEAQDTNQIQFELIRRLSGKNGNVTFIGDDFQSIYGWRGAVMDNFLNLSNRWPNIQTFKLEVNYRSRPHIVEAGNTIISQNQNQYSKNIQAHKQGEENIKVFNFTDETEEALSIINLIKKIKEEKEKNWGDFAILYRTNAQSQPLEQTLVTDGIPYKVWGGQKFFERKEIKDIVSYLKYILNPKDSVSLKRIINVPNRKIGATTISNVEDYAISNDVSLNEVIENINRIPIKLNKAALNNIEQFNTIMRFISSQVQSMTPGDIISNVVSNIRYKDYLASQENKNKAEERMENIGQLINMASKYENTGMEALENFLEEISLMTDLEEGGDGAPDAVNLMTVHASKGLEFPVIFIVGLEDNIFPLAKAKFDQRELEEERRLMYVAVTRAEDNLFLSYANSRQQWGQIKYNSPSRFLEELPAHLVKKYDLSGGGSRESGGSDLEEGDNVRHKLFGNGEVMELWNDVAIVKFENPKYGIRKIDGRFLNKN